MSASRQISEASLWLGLYCAGLPLEAAWHCHEQPPELHAVHAMQRGQPVVLAASQAAVQAGVRSGQSLSTALAVQPALQSLLRNRAAEQQLLEQLALLAWQFSSRVVLTVPDGLLLEIGGSLKLHGDLPTLLARLKQKLDRSGFAVSMDVSMGMAPIPAAARLFARHGLHTHNAPEMLQALKSLPVAAVAEDENQARVLMSLGLDRVAGLLRLPAAERARRLGAGLNTRLQELTGRLATPLIGWQPPQRFIQRLELPAVTHDSAALLFILQRGLLHLGRWLEVRSRALARLIVKLHQEHGGQIRLEVGLMRPETRMERVLELLALKLERQRLTAAVEAVSLQAVCSSGHSLAQADLWGEAQGHEDWAVLLDRLRARLGETAVAGLAVVADHRPEKAWRWVTPGQPAYRPDAAEEASADRRPRPTWLLSEPQPCRREKLQLEEGPERIEAGWWDGQPCQRDYFIARDGHGRRLWVFHEHQPRSGWFVHGLFDGQ